MTDDIYLGVTAAARVVPVNELPVCPECEGTLVPGECWMEGMDPCSCGTGTVSPASLVGRQVTLVRPGARVNACQADLSNEHVQALLGVVAEQMGGSLGPRVVGMATIAAAVPHDADLDTFGAAWQSVGMTPLDVGEALIAGGFRSSRGQWGVLFLSDFTERDQDCVDCPNPKCDAPDYCAACKGMGIVPVPVVQVGETRET